MLFFFVSIILAAENPFRSEIAPVQISGTDSGTLEVLIVVPTGFHLYRDMMHVRAIDPKGVVFEQTVYPTGLFMPDPANPKNFREHYEENVRLTVPFSVSTAGTYTPMIELRYQGCKGGLCYKPAVDVHTASIEKTNAPTPKPAPTPERQGWFQWMFGWVFSA